MFDTSGISDLSKENILSKVSELDIFKKYVRGFTDLGRKFTSELIPDEDPSCSIYQYRQTVRYRDFRESKSIDCFSYVMRKYSCNFREALSIISNDFKLNLITVPYTKFEERSAPEVRGHTSIKVTSRPWTKEDILYWTKYHLPIEFLEAEFVRSISHYWITKDGKEYYFEVGKKLAYSYQEWGKGKRKLYFPLSDNRFYGNVEESDWYNIDRLPWLGEHLIITSSNKDRLVWSFLGYNAVAPQSESARIRSEFIKGLQERFTRIYINYDNDSVGKTWAEFWREEYGLIPVYISETKDISDYIELHGIEKTRQLMSDLIIK